MPGYAEARLHELIKRLTLASEKDSIDWSETDRPYAYISTLADSQVLVATKDDDGVNPFVLEIMSDDGTIVDSIRSTLDERTGRNTRFSEDLAELYERARRKATNADFILNKLLEALPEIPQKFSDEPPF